MVGLEWNEKLFREAVFEDGLEQGLEQGRISAVLNMLKEKLPLDMIARVSEMSVEKIREIGRMHSLGSTDKFSTTILAHLFIQWFLRHCNTSTQIFPVTAFLISLPFLLWRNSHIHLKCFSINAIMITNQRWACANQ